MSIKNHNIIKIALVFTGNVIGAGFATGSELSHFFVRYGKFSFIGIIFSCMLFTLICRIVLLKIAVTGASNFTEYFADINKYFVKIMNFTVTAYLWASLCVMYSAGGAVFRRVQLPSRFGVWSVAVFCIAVLYFGAEGFVKLNRILTPVMIIGIIITAMTPFISVFSYSYLYSPILYSSYNTITAVPVLTAVSDYVDSIKTAVKASYLSGLFLILTALSLWFMLFYYGDLSAELPVLSTLNGFHRILYTVVLYIAVLTTAVGNGMGIIKNMGLKKRGSLLLLFLPAFFSQNSGLDILVSRLYPFFGGLGMIVLAVTITDGFEYLRKIE